jgi:hypothetical protein
MRGEIVDGHEAVALHPVEQFLLSCVQGEAGVSCHGDVLLRAARIVLLAVL